MAMTSKINSLFDFGEKSLTVEQADTCLRLFKESFETIKDSQVIVKQDGDKVTAIFKPLSNSGTTPKPYVYCEKISACTGIENMITVHLYIRDVAKCRSESIAKFNKPNLAKFDKILDNAHMLFAERLEAAHRIDEEQIKFAKIVQECKDAVGINARVKEGHTYPDNFLHNIEGELYHDDDSQLFTMKMEGLTADQVKQLGLVIKHL